MQKRGLVVAAISLSVLLLLGAGALARSSGSGRPSSDLLKSYAIPREYFPDGLIYGAMEDDRDVLPALDARSPMIRQPGELSATAMVIAREYRSAGEAERQWLSWIKSHPLRQATGLTMRNTHADATWAACGDSYAYSCVYIAQYGPTTVGYFQVMGDAMGHREFRDVVAYVNGQGMRMLTGRLRLAPSKPEPNLDNKQCAHFLG